MFMLNLLKFNLPLFNYTHFARWPPTVKPIGLPLDADNSQHALWTLQPGGLCKLNTGFVALLLKVIEKPWNLILDFKGA